MTFKKPTRAGQITLALGVLLGIALWMFASGYAFAEAPEAAPAAPAPPTFNKGDNAWMLTSCVLVLLMTVPGLALFYGGLVRTKNMLSVLMHVFFIVCIVVFIWVIYGYSLAFTGAPRSSAGSTRSSSRASRRLAGGDFLGRRDHPRVRLHLLPDDVRGITPALIVGAWRSA